MKPILFNTEMVQAILEGSKTTTRRIVKDIDNNYTYLGSDKQKKSVSFARNTTRLPLYIKIPYKVGEILYVRETWMIQSMKNFEKNIKFLYKAEPNQKLNEVHVSDKRYEELLKYECKNGWQPSLFMPKEAARIFLKVTNVRVERLQDIAPKGAREEGIREYTKDDKVFKYAVNEDQYLWRDMPREPIQAFGDLWDTTTREYKWRLNPWVWVISFERCEKPND